MIKKAKRVFQINAFVLSLTPVVEKIAERAAVAKKAIGFLHQQKCRHACVLSLTPIVEKK